MNRDFARSRFQAPLLPGAAIYLTAIVLTLITLWGVLDRTGGDSPASASALAANTAQACPVGQCFTDVLPSNPFFATANRIYQQGLVSGYSCGQNQSEPCDAQHRPYFRWASAVTRGQLSKFVDNARRMPGIYLDSSLDTPPIYARTTFANAQAIAGLSVNGVGVYARSDNSDGLEAYSNGTDKSAVFAHHDGNGYGVFGRSGGGYGVAGYSGSGLAGVYGTSAQGDGVFGESTFADKSGVIGHNDLASGHGVTGKSDNGVGVYGEALGSSGWAGYFNDDVRVVNMLSVGGSCTGCLASTWSIDHPDDPAGKTLTYGAVSSPERTNMYSGVVTTDASGAATVTLPAYVEEINRDFRYQLTVMGQFAQAIVASKIDGGSFQIRTDRPDVEVSWQVVGMRNDLWAQANPLQVEQDKPADQGGTYLYPLLYGQPAGVVYVMPGKGSTPLASK